MDSRYRESSWNEKLEFKGESWDGYDLTNTLTHSDKIDLSTLGTYSLAVVSRQPADCVFDHLQWLGLFARVGLR